MNKADYLRMAFFNIKSNPVRTLLTMLGIIIGTACLIAVYALGRGGEWRIRDELQKFGIQRVWVYSCIDQNDQAPALTMVDASYLEQTLKGVESVQPTAYLQAGLKGPVGNAQVQLRGCTWGIEQEEGFKLLSGRTLSFRDAREARSVIVLPQAVARQLFGEQQAVGQSVGISGIEFRVIGVLQDDSALGSGSTARCMIPLTTMQRYLGRTTIDEIALTLDNGDAVEPVAQVAQQLLDQRYQGQGYFRTVTLSKETQLASNIVLVFLLIIASVAALSLLVGGIGVMNIMLVTVRERRQEIGVRKALGATRRQILAQFLLESVLIALGGGLGGMLLGTGLTLIAASAIGLPVMLDGMVYLAAAGFSAVVGVFFGTYPARQAARLEPIAALRQG